MPARTAFSFIAPIVFDALTKTGATDNAVIKRNVAVEVERQLAPRIAHETNNEPWFRSRVTWGALASTLAGISTLIMVFTTSPLDFEQLYIALMAIGGGLTTIWGRWAAKTPIGQ